MDMCLRVLKESNKSSLRQLQSSGTVYWSYPILPFEIVACTFFPTTFLEIAVYGLRPGSKNNKIYITKQEGC